MHYISKPTLLRMFRSLLPLFTLWLTLEVAAQGYGDVWQFGYQVGLDFSACEPVVITGANTGFEGTASICDANGQLLFYTNTEKVWNQQHQLMPNGTLYVGANTLSQVLIAHVDAPTNSLYYIITTTIQGQLPGRLRYHVVDMSEDGGLGDVVAVDNVLFADTSTEHVGAVRHANGTDIWVVAHGYPGNTFLAYLLTTSGLSTTPVVSSTGPAFVPCNSNVNTRGELKFSVDGTRLAISGNGVGNEPVSDLLALFHFDAATGVVSDPLELPAARGDFGLSFSPDGYKLYGATWKALNFLSSDVNTLYQFDLSSGDPATIIASGQVILTTGISEPFGSLKLAPDGRIYVASNGREYLGVIGSPDESGAACDFQYDGLYLEGATSGFGLNNYIEYVDCGSTSTGAVSPVASGELTLFPNPTDALITVGGAVERKVHSIHLHDAAGREVMVVDVRAASTFAISRLSAGGYQATFLDENRGVVERRSIALMR